MFLRHVVRKTTIHRRRGMECCDISFYRNGVKFHIGVYLIFPAGQRVVFFMYRITLNISSDQKIYIYLSEFLPPFIYVYDTTGRIILTLKYPSNTMFIGGRLVKSILTGPDNDYLRGLRSVLLN